MRDSLNALIDSMVLNGLFDETVSGNGFNPRYIILNCLVFDICVLEFPRQISDFIGLINWTSIPVLPALFSINLTNTDFDTLR